MENAIKGANGVRFTGTWDLFVDLVNKSPEFVGDRVYEERDLFAAWRRGSLHEIEVSKK